MKPFRNDGNNLERRTRNKRRNLLICPVDLKSETSQNAAASRKLPTCPKRSQMTSQNSPESRKLPACSKVSLGLLTARLRAARIAFPWPHPAFIAFRGPPHKLKMLIRQESTHVIQLVHGLKHKEAIKISINASIF